MGKRITKLLLMLPALVLVGCKTTPPEIPASMMAAEDTCFQEVARAKIAMAQAHASQRVSYGQFTDERNYVMALAIEKLGDAAKPEEVSDFVPCTLTVQTFLKEHGMTQRSNYDIWRKGIGAFTVVGGIIASGDALEGVIGAAAGAKAGATTYNNSRVTTVGDQNQGIQASSSGETLNLGTTSAVSSSQAQGGLEPRQSQEQGDGYLDGPSQSGTNGNIDVSPGDDMVPEEPVQLPVEE